MLCLKYLWNNSKYELSKVLWNIINEIWSAFWAFLVWICRYPIRVMYLLDLVQFLLDNTHETKIQAFTKKYNVTILIFAAFILLLLLLLLLLLPLLFVSYRRNTNFVFCTTGQIDTVGTCRKLINLIINQQSLNQIKD